VAFHAMERCGTGIVARTNAGGAIGWRRVCAALVLVLITHLSFASTAAAAEGSAARKVGRGFANVTLGVLAIPGEMVQRTKKSGPGLGVTVGFAWGVGKFVAHEVVGVWEILTCPFEWPPDFRPILDPEFPWEYFTGRTRYGKTKDDW